MVDIRRQGTTAERPQGPIPETGCRVPGDIRAAEVLATSPGHFLVSEVGGHCRHCQQERRASDMAVAPGICLVSKKEESYCRWYTSFMQTLYILVQLHCQNLQKGEMSSLIFVKAKCLI